MDTSGGGVRERELLRDLFRLPSGVFSGAVEFGEEDKAI